MNGMPLVSGSVKLGFVLLLGIAWYVSSAHQLVNPLLVPSFTATMQDLWTLLRDGVFWPDLRITLYELVVAFAIASILGLAVGYAVSRTRYTIKVFDPLFSSLYSVPTILLFPLFVLFFGLGSGSKIAMGATIAFFPVVLTTIAGLGNAEVGLVKAARSMGASDWQMFWQIMLPASLPVVLGGLRIGMVSALLAILGTETIAAIGGLGHQIVNYSDAMDTPMMFAYTLLVLAIATALNSLVTALEGFARQRIA